MYAITILQNGMTSWRAINSADEALPSESVSDAPPASSLADYIADMTVAIQAWLDSTARQNGYDSCASCVGYESSSVPQYAADASAMRKWRDAVWPAAYAIQTAQAASPPDPLPTAAQLIAQLPQPIAYGWGLHTPGA